MQLKQDQQALCTAITRELLRQRWGVEPNALQRSLLFSSDLTRAKEWLDERLVATAQAARWAVARTTDSVVFSEEVEDETARLAAWQKLLFLEAEFNASSPDDWEPHSILRGPRKGQQVWKNTKTGSLRDDPPRDPNHEITKKTTKGDGATPTPSPGGNGETITPVAPTPRPEKPLHSDPVIAEKLKQIQEQKKIGLDPGRNMARGIRIWIDESASRQQAEQIAASLGVQVMPSYNKTRIAYDVEKHLKLDFYHPGQESVDMYGTQKTLEDGKTNHQSAWMPRSIANHLKGYGKDEIDYLSRSLGVSKQGDSMESQRKAILKLAVDNFEKAGDTERTRALTEEIRNFGKAPDSSGPKQQEDMRFKLLAISEAEVNGVSRKLGLSQKSEELSDYQAIARVETHLSACHLKNQLAGDTESTKHTAAMANLFTGEYRAASDSIRELEQRLGELCKQPINQKTRDEYLEIRTQINVPTGQRAEMLDEQRQALYQLLKPKTPAVFEIQYDGSAQSPHRESTAGALAFFQKTLATKPGDPAILSQVSVINALDGRACAGSKGDYKSEVSLSYGISVGTAVHEFGHVIEFHHPGVKKLSGAFSNLRDLHKEEAVSLQEKFPGSGYDSDEQGRKDDFEKCFGSASEAYYCGKTYGDGCTEIISMGVEQLYREPAGFCARDPQYAQFIIGILRGSLR